MSQFITTFTGRKFHFDDITPGQICIEDIAHTLSMLCRFTGHVHQFYSVAQHSLLVDKQIKGSPEVHLAALLHDAAEAYVNDLSSPLKNWLCGAYPEDVVAPYKELHDTILSVIYEKFGVSACLVDRREIHLYDSVACVFEAEAFLGLDREGLQENSFDTSLREWWKPWCPNVYRVEAGDRPRQNVEDEFLIRFHELAQMCHI